MAKKDDATEQPKIFVRLSDKAGDGGFVDSAESFHLSRGEVAELPAVLGAQTSRLLDSGVIIYCSKDGTPLVAKLEEAKEDEK